MTCDPKDRHVLAAAVRSDAAVLVTFNMDDFPDTSTAGCNLLRLTAQAEADAWRQSADAHAAHDSAQAENARASIRSGRRRYRPRHRPRAPGRHRRQPTVAPPTRQPQPGLHSALQPEDLRPGGRGPA
jgi:hypothetical protein